MSDALVDALREALDDIGFATVEIEGERVVDASPRFCDLAGYTREELLALPDVGPVLPPADRVEVLSELRDALEGTPTRSGHALLLRRDGVPVDIEVASRLVRGDASRLLCIVRDVSDEVRRRDQLAAYAELLQRLPMGLILWRVEHDDPDGVRIVGVNRAALAGSGRRPEDLLGRSLHDVLGDGADDRAGGLLTAHRERRVVDLGEVVATESDGLFAPGTYRRAVVPLPGDLVASLVENVTARREAERSRRDLLQRLVDAGTEERRRVAVGLHDDVIQTLAASLFELEAARGARDDSSVAASLGRIEGRIRDVIDRLRRLVFELAPPELEQGLAAGVELAAAKTFDGTGTRVECDVRLDVEPDPDVASMAYLIVAEALVNARRHAGASRVRVHLTSDDAVLAGSVEDDGVGAVELVTPPGHLGLRTMRERAAVLGGNLTVRSAPGEGTSVSFRVPVRSARAAVDG